MHGEVNKLGMPAVTILSVNGVNKWGFGTWSWRKMLFEKKKKSHIWRRALLIHLQIVFAELEITLCKAKMLKPKPKKIKLFLLQSEREQNRFLTKTFYLESLTCHWHGALGWLQMEICNLSVCARPVPSGLAGLVAWSYKGTGQSPGVAGRSCNFIPIRGQRSIKMIVKPQFQGRKTE